MSRIGRNPITVPSSVSVSVVDSIVSVKGPNGSMTRILPDGITLHQEGDQLNVERLNDETMYRSLHGLTRTLVSNMVTGVTEGWSKELEIIGVGYRAAAGAPGVLDLALGFSHPVKFTAPEGHHLRGARPHARDHQGRRQGGRGPGRRDHPQDP